MSYYFLPASFVSDEKLTIHLNVFFSQYVMIWFSCCFQDSCIVFGIQQVDFGMFRCGSYCVLLFGSHWNFWMCKLIFSSNLRSHQLWYLQIFVCIFLSLISSWKLMKILIFLMVYIGLWGPIHSYWFFFSFFPLIDLFSCFQTFFLNKSALSFSSESFTSMIVPTFRISI